MVRKRNDSSSHSYNLRRQCCVTALPEAWLPWLYSYLNLIGPLYYAEQHERLHVLYELLAGCLDADILILEDRKSTKYFSNVVFWESENGSEERRERISSVVQNPNDSGWVQISDFSSRIRIPNMQAEGFLWVRTITSEGLRIVVGVKTDNPRKRICESCIQHVAAFVQEPEELAGRRPLVSRGGCSLLGMDMPDLALLPLGLSTQSVEEVRSRLELEHDVGVAIEVATESFARAFRASFGMFGPQGLEQYFGLVWNTLGGAWGSRNHVAHAFSFSIILDKARLLSRPSAGYGYLLTRPQLGQIENRVGLRDTDSIRKILERTEFGSESRRGLVAFVTSWRYPLWSRNLFADRLWRDAISTPGINGALGRAASMEDRCVHRVASRVRGNFLFEFPVLVRDFRKQPTEVSPSAVVFFVLRERPPAPIMSLLLLAARMTVPHFAQLTFSVLDRVAQREYEATSVINRRIKEFRSRQE